MENNRPKKVIEVGKFYLIHDGSKTGHPGLIVWKNDEFNLYLALKFGTTSNKNNLPLKRSIGGGAIESFIYKKLFLGKRKDFGKLFTDNLVFEGDDQLIQRIYSNCPTESKSIKRKDRYHFKRLFSGK